MARQQDEVRALKRQIEKLASKDFLSPMEKSRLKALDAKYRKLDKSLQQAIEYQLRIPGVGK